MNTIVILAVVAVIAAVFIVAQMGDKADKQQVFLEKLSKIAQSSPQPIEGYENAYRIPFQYEGIDCVYEDYEDPGFQASVYKGILKLPLSSKPDFVLTFSEKTRSSIRANVTSISEVSNPWAKDAARVKLPKSLEEFNAFSNDANLANQIMLKEPLVKIFIRYKCRDSRGSPIGSLEIMNGMLVLRFHSSPDLKPSRFQLRNNVSTIEEHVRNLKTMADGITELIRG